MPNFLSVKYLYSNLKINITLYLFAFFCILLCITSVCFWGMGEKKQSDQYHYFLEQIAQTIEKSTSWEEEPWNPSRSPSWKSFVEKAFSESIGSLYYISFYEKKDAEAAKFLGGWGTMDIKTISQDNISSRFTDNKVWLDRNDCEILLHPAKKNAWLVFVFSKPSHKRIAYFGITFFILFFVGSLFVVLFSWLFTEKFIPRTQNFEKRISEEISGCNHIFSNIHNSWNDYVLKRECKKREWTRSVGETSKLRENLVNSSKEPVERLEKICKFLQEQTNKIETMANSLSEISNDVKSVASHAEAAVTTSTSSENDAKRGGEIVSQIIKHMNKITQTVSKSAMVIRELGKRSTEIVDIINVIDDIADQTDLLALNAAIEAARAGAQGRGFAVVADQVRSLAEKTSHATKEIAATLSSIQEKTSEAVASMDEGIREIDVGAGYAVQAGVSLRRIVSGAKCVTEMVSKIAKDAEKQSQVNSSTSSLISEILQGFKNTQEGSQLSLGSLYDLQSKIQHLSELIQNLLNIWMDTNSEEIIVLGEWTYKEVLLRNQRLEKVCKHALE